MQELKIGIPLTAPQQVETIVEKASQKEIPGTLMKTIVNLDRDRLMVKRLAMNL